MANLNHKPRLEVLGPSRRQEAKRMIRQNHYTHSIPSGKSHYMRFGDAIVVWSIPANKNIARFLLGRDGNAWELSRLWAPDGHDRNLLSQAVSAATRAISKLEGPDVLVAYADPNQGHTGGVYKACSWEFHGQSEESRLYLDPKGKPVARRAFHSGDTAMTKAEIIGAGFTETTSPGKLRFVKFLNTRKKLLAKKRSRITEIEVERPGLFSLRQQFDLLPATFSGAIA